MRFFARLPWLSAALSLLAGLGAVVGDAAAAVDLAPHRAFYTGALEVRGASAGIVAVSGSMATSLVRACDGWITSAQSIVDVTLEGGQVTRQDQHFASWEALDGTAYRFTSRQRVGDVELGFKGAARAASPGGGEVEYTLPAKKTIALPPATVFPTRYLASLIERAQAGARQDVGMVFGGAGGIGPQRVAAFIGTPQPAAAAAVTRLGPLAARPGWRMQISFYEPDGRSPSPHYEVEALQLDNGIITEMVMTMGPIWGRFSILKVEAVPAPRCQP
jgi:hypothetical protein